MKTFLLRYPRFAKFLPSVLIIFATITVYAGNINGKFLWDDDPGILYNRHIHEPGSYFLNFFSDSMYSGSGTQSYYWRPVVLVLFSIQWHLFYSWEPIYHATNIAFHAANGILIFYLFRKIFRRETAALFAAIVFAVHPLNVSVVTYISGIADPLSVFFILLGILSCLKSRENNEKQKLYTLLSALLLILALMTKESALITPFLMLICVLFTERNEIHSWKILALKSKPLWPFFAIAALFILSRVTVLDFRGNLPTSFDETSFFERVLTFFHAYAVYLSLLFSPIHLHMDRSIPLAKSLLSIPVMSGLILLSATIVLFFTEIKRRPMVSFGIAWFLVALSPNANIFIPTVSYLNEHWLYLGLSGFFFTVYALLEDFFQKNGIGRFVAVPVLVIVVGTFGYLTIERTHEWSDAITLFTATLREVPRDYRANLNLGLQYLDQKEYDKANELFERALSVMPTGALAYNARGLLDIRIGHKDAAMKDFERSVELDPYSPAFPRVANEYIAQKKYKELRKILERQLEKPRDPLETEKILLTLASIAAEEGNRPLVKKYLNLAKDEENSPELYFPKMIDVSAVSIENWWIRMMNYPIFN